MKSSDRQRRVMFFHGAGGYIEDRPLAHALGLALGAEVVMPALPDQDMSVQAWAAVVEGALNTLRPDDFVVGHSFGASILLGLLGQPGWPADQRVALLAMPDWGPRGWAVEEYVVEGPQPGCPVSLHHCRDDAVVPFSHLALNASRLPSASLSAYDSGGHQFGGRAFEIAAWLMNR